MWLAGIAGFVDAVGYIQLHRLFVAHMTGNTDQLGQQLARSDIAAAVPLVVAVATFVISIAFVTGLTDAADEAGLRSPTVAALAVEAALLALFMGYGSYVIERGRVPSQGPAFYVCLVAAVAAMGSQTAAVTKWGGRTIRTTYLSGMLTRLGQELARLPMGRHGEKRGGKGAEPAAALVYFALFAGFLGGAVLGTWTLARIELWAVAVPLAAVVAAAGVDWWRPTT